MEPHLSFFIRQTFFIILEVFMNNLVNQSTSLLPSFLCHLVLMISEGRAGIEFLYPHTYLLIEVRAPACFFFSSSSSRRVFILKEFQLLLLLQFNGYFVVSLNTFACEDHVLIPLICTRLPGGRRGKRQLRSENQDLHYLSSM